MLKMKAVMGVALILATVEYCPGCVPDPPPCIDLGFPMREIPDFVMPVGDTMLISLEEDYFDLPPECLAEYSHPDDPFFEVASSDSASVAVSMADLTTVEIVALEARVTYSARVTVVAVDQGGRQEFLVGVWDPIEMRPRSAHHSRAPSSPSNGQGDPK